MSRPCATPGCETLTFGDICLRCMQRQARLQRAAREDDGDAASADKALSAESPR